MAEQEERGLTKSEVEALLRQHTKQKREFDAEGTTRDDILKLLERFPAPGRRAVTGGAGINIPLTAQTNPAAFPPYQFRPYPKQIVKAADEAYIEQWRKDHMMRDPHTDKPYWERPAPNPGDPVPVLATRSHVEAGFARNVGEPLQVSNRDDEIALLEELGLKPYDPKKSPQTFSVETGDGESELDRVRAENTALERELQRNAELRARLRALSNVDETDELPAPAPKKAKGWPKGKPRGKGKPATQAEPEGTQTLDEFART